MHADHIGARLAYWRRRRGMTQAVLAGLAGVSQSFVSHVEAGRRSVERRSTLVALARALQVTVADLLGQPGDPTDPLKSDVAAAAPAIRAALIEIEEGERHAPRKHPDELAAAIEQMADLRARSDYAAMAPLLPALLPEAAVAGHIPLTRVAYQASACLRRFGYRDLALSAARVAVNAASAAEDPAWIGAARFAHMLTLPPEVAATTGRLADRTVAQLQAGAADPAVRQVLGQLHMSASFAHAVAGHDDDARAHLGAAQQEAESLGDPVDGLGFNNMAFGPTNVKLWRMAVAVEGGEYGSAIELSKQVDPGPLRVVDRHQAYWLDLGRAYAHSGRTDREALAAFTRAERAAPVPFSVNPLVRDSLTSMMYRAQRRTVPDDLRILARRVGLEVPA